MILVIYGSFLLNWMKTINRQENNNAIERVLQVIYIRTREMLSGYYD